MEEQATSPGWRRLTIRDPALLREVAWISEAARYGWSLPKLLLLLRSGSVAPACLENQIQETKSC